MRNAVAINLAAPHICTAQGSGNNIAYSQLVVGFQCGACLHAGVRTVYLTANNRLTSSVMDHWIDVHFVALNLKVCHAHLIPIPLVVTCTAALTDLAL